MKIVEAGFITNDQKDHGTNRDPGRQAKDFYDRLLFVAFGLSKSDCQEIPAHGMGVGWFIATKQNAIPTES
jgi:hypothetical protein